ncbi:DUF4189 domain-containing protein [Pseudoxanthomonas sacheonensis]|uniref:DUF4189 domain-containing protein n=1 Tax=Pseudoxanthomonas sacheonensis TaxID=443615 RepID=UPI0013D59822|nr:hypothetical protein CSC73_13500 [Pseudoxanthomonas sacheonensis]
MKQILLMSLILLGVNGGVHAEGGCPSGMIPYRGTDISSCGPIPSGYYGRDDSSTEPSQSPVIWADKWGAIALSKTNNSVGVATGTPSKQAAQNSAVKDCVEAGGQNCEVVLSYNNQCAAMAWGDTRVGTARAGTIEIASQQAMQSCIAKSNECRIVYSNCSFAERTQ